MPEIIKERDYESEIAQLYVDYAMSVITERALPDVRDGLKPVQRRILYALNSLSKSDGPHRKCARIVGDTMGKYHPHGDASIYESLVHMAQFFKMPIPLVDPHGNFGSIDGSGASAMRYTEARMSKFVEKVCMNDLSFFKDQFVPNFDETEKEPTFLPFQVPNILISGVDGVAVGMATKIPTHNLGEVIDATITYLNNEDCSLDDIMEHLIAPDFSTGGIVNVSREQMKEIYRTGSGKIKVRGKVEIRDGAYGRKSICVTEIPQPMVGKTGVFLDTVAELVKNRELPAVVDIADRGDKTEECLCIDVKKGTTKEEIDNIINILYKKAKLEDTFGVNMRVIDGGKPKVMGIMEILKVYTAFKYDLYTTKYTKLLAKKEEEKEIKEGLLCAVDCIDLIIEILRGSKKVSDAKECLMYGKVENIKFKRKKSKEEAQHLCFTELQANSILEMKLQKLIGLEIDILRKELKEVDKLIKEFSTLLSSKTAMKKRMVIDLEEIKKEFAIPRRTKVLDLGDVKIEKVKEEKIDVAILVDRFSYAKVIERSIYDKNESSIRSDYKRVILCSNLDRIFTFTDANLYKVCRVMDIVKAQGKKNNTKKGESSLYGKLSDKGIPISSILPMGENEVILSIGTVEDIISEEVVFVSKDGNIKKVDGIVFDTSRKSSTACKQEEDIVFVGCGKGKDIVMKSNNGYFFRASISDVAVKGKGASCSKFFKLDKGDFITEVQVGTTKDVFSEKNIPFTKIKLCTKGSKGVKMRV